MKPSKKVKTALYTVIVTHKSGLVQQKFIFLSIFTKPGMSFAFKRMFFKKSKHKIKTGKPATGFPVIKSN